jgi:hypothetical protein
MDKRLFELVHQRTHKINPRVAEGYAVQPMKLVEGYVDRIFRTAAVDFPPELKYLGYMRCTPHEEYSEITKRLNKQQSNTNRSTFELARSDLYMVKYMFSFNGEELDPRYLYLPFCGPAGMITIRGSTFAISPVAADNGISVGDDHLFIPLTRLKVTFRRVPHHFMRNGERETAYVVWSKIHQSKPPKGVKIPVQGHTTIPHYIFAKYGVTETFRRFLDAEVVVGDAMSVNQTTHPPEEWVVCASAYSAMFRPQGVRDRNYVAPDIRLAIRKEKYDLTAISMIGGFFYVADRFPERMLPDYVDETRQWIILLGHLLFGPTKGEGKLAEEMIVHMRAVDGYMDAESKNNLAEAQIDVEDTYQLFFHLIATFSHRVTQSRTEVSSLYGKRLTVLRYVLKDLTEAINNFMFKVASPKKKALTKLDANKMLRDMLKTMLVMGINKDHIEVSSTAVPGDNMYFKVTSMMALQTDSKGGRGKSSTSPNDPTKHLHVSIAEVGSYSTMSKSDATGRRKINPYVKTDENDTIIRDPDKIELLESVQRMIQRRN